ncbi:hypothetical protein BBO99_00008208 [Phytophthora kernoviae]|uniref:Ubiquitin carboxyl-terminal hydrolase n=2 Tax=Phytophthora kernoviae TaxID=325452 RepID=A0A3R7MTU9_9STRA|nr:hypothetical protein G195_009478 [Phytophthora kernoviae 00238/432]KAG2512970.1 hypothetical protein JM16_007951 [Phytophthora kernoviae]KAG2517200.1 hypothetical protein JM18_007870 [Phytophthora kernoviae]RLN37318.1 hypothetical protein BBI17_008166 [Phytophthora kernoviae]RLN75611.1 hypothetical protein BBO99_00008208 [Phytophthora kernoviae]
MAGDKSCRHVGHAVRLSEFRRELKKRTQLTGVLNLDTRKKDVEIDNNGDMSGSDMPNGLLSMPVRTKARDEKTRRRMLKTAVHNRAGPAQELSITPVTGATEQEPSGGDANGVLPSTVLGFTNLGNTCYFNASIQALLTATHYFPEHTHIENILETTNTPITTTFTMLHETVKKRARRALEGAPPSERRVKSSRSGRPRSGSSSVLTVAPLLKEMRKKFSQFRGHYQQDAHELFTSFLWAIDEEMDPPLPLQNDASAGSPSKTGPNGHCENSVSSSTCNDSEPTDDGEQETEGEGSESDADNSEQEETKQIFVKTETGETISMQVPKDATVKEVQHLLAKRLNLNEEDMVLDASKVETTRATLSSRQSAVLHARAEKRKMYSKLNFTRSLFGGALTTAVTCTACGKRTEIVEDAFHLSVSVPEGGKRGLTTVNCLDNFVSETQLLVEANNGYDCEKCSRQPKVRSAAGRFIRKKRLGPNAEPEMETVLRDASMQLYVSALPRILVVHIKRLARSRKITQHIAFDDKLDVTPYVSETLRNGGGEAKNHSLCYELIAVVVHMGNKRSGHYVAYVSRSRRRDALLLSRSRSRHLSEENASSSPEATTPTTGRVTSAKAIPEQGDAGTVSYSSDSEIANGICTVNPAHGAQDNRHGVADEVSLVLRQAQGMSGATPDDSTSEVNGVGAESVAAADGATLEKEFGLHEAESKQWREELDNQRSALGDAEDICVFLFDDLLLAIFQEMHLEMV